MTEVDVRERLTRDQVDEVERLVAAVTAADGVGPVSEHVLMHLRAGALAGAAGGRAAGGADAGAAAGPGGRALLARDDGRLVGFAYLELAAGGGTAELAVAPAERGRGIGGRLLDAVVAAAPAGPLGIWAHGQLPAAVRLAASRGFVPERVLWQLRRPLDDALPEPALPAGVSVRTFVVGQDEQAWTQVNNRAFVEHPEQGGWDVAEVRLREQEPWFDPGGFFLAERDGSLVGFHWTKVHAPTADDPAMGEVYVVGIDPSAQGGGLATALTLVGLRHLQQRGLPGVLLYVDESNPAAMRVYEKLGFTRYRSDVLYRRG